MILRPASGYVCDTVSLTISHRFAISNWKQFPACYIAFRVRFSSPKEPIQDETRGGTSIGVANKNGRDNCRSRHDLSRCIPVQQCGILPGWGRLVQCARLSFNGLIGAIQLQPQPCQENEWPPSVSRFNSWKENRIYHGAHGQYKLNDRMFFPSV